MPRTIVRSRRACRLAALVVAVVVAVLAGVLAPQRALAVSKTPKALYSSQSQTLYFVYDENEYVEGMSSFDGNLVKWVWSGADKFVGRPDWAKYNSSGKYLGALEWALDSSGNHVSYKPGETASGASGSYDYSTILKAKDTYKNEIVSRDAICKHVVFDPSFADFHGIPSLEAWFYGLYHLEDVKGIEYLDSSQATSLKCAFYGTNNLHHLDIAQLSTPNLTNIEGLFSGADLYEIDLSGWDTSKVTTMCAAFYLNAHLVNADFSGFTAESLLIVNGMFEGCQSLKFMNLSKFSPQGVSNYFGMLAGCRSLETVLVPNNCVWGVASGGNIQRVFVGCSDKLVGKVYGAGGSILKSYTYNNPGGYDNSDINLTCARAATTSTKGYFTSANSYDSFNITYRDNFPGGSNTVRTYMFKSLSGVTSYAPRCTAEREGYVFVGWNTLASPTRDNPGTWYFPGDELPDAATTLYAQWKYDLSLATLSLEYDSVVYDGSKLPEPEVRVDLSIPSAGLDVTLQEYDPNTGEGDFVTTYVDNDKSGTATAVVTALFDVDGHRDEALYAPYTGTKSTTFTVRSTAPHDFYAVKSGSNMVLTTVRPASGATYATGNTDVVYNASTLPWRSYASTVTKVYVDGSMSTILPKSLAYWFNGFTKVTAINNVQNLDTSYCTNLSHTFAQCMALTSLDLTSWSTGRVTTMAGCFQMAKPTSSSKSKLTSLDVSTWDTSSVTDMSYMLYGTQLTRANLATFSTASLERADYMLSYMTAMREVNVSNWATPRLTSMASMLAGASSLVDLDLSSFDTTRVTSMGNVLDGCSSLNSLLVGPTWSTASSSSKPTFPRAAYRLDDGSFAAYAASATVPGFQESVAGYNLYSVNKKTCAVQYRCNGGESTQAAFVTATSGASVTLPTPTRAGYTLAGWYSDAQFATRAGNGGGSYIVNASVTLYAKWDPAVTTVALDSRGATTAGSTTVTATMGQDLPAVVVPTKTGYDFGGYFTEPGGLGTQYVNPDGSSRAKWDETSVRKLFADWVPAEFDVTLTCKDASGATIQATKAKGTYATTVAADDLAPAIPGYTYRADPANTCKVQPDDTSNQMTLTFEANSYEVTLSAADATTAGTAKVSATFGAAMPAATMPARTGYTLAGYFDTATGGSKYYDADGTSARVWDKPAATTLFAQWTANTYDLVLDPGEATEPGTTSATATYESALPQVQPAVRTGHTLLGYFDAATGGSKYYNADGTSARAWDKAEGATLHARWEADTHDIAFDPAGGALAGAKAPVTIAQTYGTTWSLPAYPSWPGRTFLGWYVDGAPDDAPVLSASDVTAGEGKATSSTTASFALTVPTTLRARWSVDAYAATFAVEEASQGFAALAADPVQEGLAYGSFAQAGQGVVAVPGQETAFASQTLLGWRYEMTDAETGAVSSGLVEDYESLALTGPVTFTADFAAPPYVAARATDGRVGVSATGVPAPGASSTASVDGLDATGIVGAGIAFAPVDENHRLARVTVRQLGGASVTIEAQDGELPASASTAVGDATVSVAASSLRVASVTVGTSPSLDVQVDYEPIATSYEVRHMRMAADGSTYEQDGASQTVPADAGSAMALEPRFYDGFTYARAVYTNAGGTEAAPTVRNDGATVVELRYDRLSFGWRVSFVDDAGATVAPDATGTQLFGTQLDLASHLSPREGYAAPTASPESLAISSNEADNAVTVTYARNDYAFAVRYLDEAGLPIADASTGEAPFGTEVLAADYYNAADIAGYTFNAASAPSVTVSADPAANAIDLAYTRDGGYGYTVRYVSSADPAREVAPAATGRAPFGQAVSASDFAIEAPRGYELATAGADITVHTDAQAAADPSLANVITFVFAPKDYEYAVTYVDTNGNTVAPTKSGTAGFDSTLVASEQAPSSAPAGYAPGPAASPETLTITDDPEQNLMTITYTPIRYGYEVRYADTTGATLKAATTGEADFASTVSADDYAADITTGGVTYRFKEAEKSPLTIGTSASDNVLTLTFEPTYAYTITYVGRHNGAVTAPELAPSVTGKAVAGEELASDTFATTPIGSYAFDKAKVNGGSEQASATLTVASGAANTLTLYYERTTYDVAFRNWDMSAVEGTGEHTELTEGTSRVTFSPAQTPTRPADAKYAYAFKGFYPSTAGVGTPFESGMLADGTETYYACYDTTPTPHGLSVDLAGGTTTASVPEAMGFGTTLELPDPKREGFSFYGWALSGEAASLSEGDGASTLTMGTSDATLRALWRAIPAQARDGLSFDGSAQVGVPASAGYALSGVSRADGSTAGCGVDASGNAFATDAGTYTATSTLASPAEPWSDDGSTSPRTVSFTVAPRDISEATIATIEPRTFDGGAQRPDLSVTYGGKALAPDVDYTVSYRANVNATDGGATATVTGIGNFAGTASTSFTIERATIEPQVVLPSWTYGSPASPSVTGNPGSGEVTYEYRRASAPDADFSPEAPAAVGDYVVRATVAQTANYLGAESSPVTFSITPRPLTVTCDSKTKSFGDDDPALTGTVDGLAPGEEATGLTYSRAEGENAGTYEISAAWDNPNYAVEVSKASLTIEPADIADVAVAPIPGETYTGSEHEPKPSVTFKGATLVEGVDYALTYSGNVAAGTATVTLEGRGNFQGTTSAAFAIGRADRADFAVALDGWTYGQSAATPTVSGNSEGESVAFAYKREGEPDTAFGPDVPTQAGSYVVRATSAQTANYNEATATTGFQVAKAAVTIAPNDASKAFGAADPVLTGTVTGVVAGDDLGVAYSRQAGGDAGTYVISASWDEANTNYQVSASTATFTIEPVPVTLELSVTGWTYGDAPVAPSVSGQDASQELVVEYRPADAPDDAYATAVPTDAGAYVVRATAKASRNFAAATATADLTVAQASLTDASTSVAPIPDQSFAAVPLTPVPSVSWTDSRGQAHELAHGTDFECSYEDNVEAGEAKVTISGRGNFRSDSSVTTSFTITPTTVNLPTAVLGLVYDGTEQAGVTAALNLCVVEGGSAVDAGEHVATVSLADPRNSAWAGGGTDPVTVTFSIDPASISQATIAPIADQVETGEPIEPALDVTALGRTLAAGVDYEAAYESNVGVGTATVTISGTGNWTGTAQATFQVVPDRPDAIPMFRLYNPYSGEHFYTSSPGEREFLSRVGWNYEGVGWWAPIEGGEPVYRLYNPYAGDHHYTPSPGERDALVAAGWNYEGVGWNSGGDVPVLRQYNPYATVGTHNFTTSEAENDALVRNGWNFEGVGWMAVAAG
ncbi:BspA family leucine-rich repeat surface protein [Olsenella intestinalis]|uniref:BspA family leucine-rich repeat surface protein n=1 Tax=Olsenella intestinalis TaxID=2930083 RepID=UPI0024B0F843|nr:BspA family leucine-rich repeat surface protein [Olsenella intestinalis]